MSWLGALVIFLVVMWLLGRSMEGSDGRNHERKARIHLYGGRRRRR